MLTKGKRAKAVYIAIGLYLFVHLLIILDSGMPFAPDERTPFLLKRADDNMGFLAKALKDKPHLKKDDVESAARALVWKDAINEYEWSLADNGVGWLLRASPRSHLTYRYPLVVRALFFRWDAIRWPVFTLNTESGKYAASPAIQEPAR